MTKEVNLYLSDYTYGFLFNKAESIL
jgi:hypothetical protein